MNSERNPIPVIFNQGRSLEIPFFQRGYVWGEENWQRFLDDMLNISPSGPAYFMGSLILKQVDTPSGSEIGDRRIVVDGQQRLSTIVVFFKTVCDFLDESKFFDRNFYNNADELILTHNHNDIEVFRAIIQNQLSDQLREKYKSNRLLECYDFFLRQPETLKKINIRNLIGKIEFIGVDLRPGEDEQQIFDTINSLGVMLTTAELLKNHLFHREDIGFYQETWKATFESDEETKEYWDHEVTSGRSWRANIDLLLQSFLLIQSKAVERYSGVKNLFGNYKAYLKDSGTAPKTLVTNLVEYAKIYREYVVPELLNQDIDENSPVERLNAVLFGLNTTTAIPYFLYVIKEVEDVVEQNKMFRLLETYLLRRLVCRETTKNYNNLFASFIRNGINSYDKLLEKFVGAEDATNKMPGDDDLGTGFETSNLTNQQARVVLYLIEKTVRDKTKYGTTPVGFNRYSLEHIMPKKWRNNWKNNLSEEDALKRDRILLKLGNLTLITSSLNSAIRDADWPTKKAGKGGWKGLEKYAQGLEIFSKYLKLETWNEGEIKKRSDELFEYSKKVWPYPSAS